MSFDRLQLFAKWYIILIEIRSYDACLSVGENELGDYFFLRQQTADQNEFGPTITQGCFCIKQEVNVMDYISIAEAAKNGESQGAGCRCFAHKEESKDLSAQEKLGQSLPKQRNQRTHALSEIKVMIRASDVQFIVRFIVHKLCDNKYNPLHYQL